MTQETDRDGVPQFTPGPWGVEQFGGSIYVGKLRDGRAGFDDVLYATDCKDYTASAVARELANARLIAAAPRLYNALLKLVALDEAALSIEVGVSCDADEHDAAIAEAHAALIEARVAQ